jgi:HD-like signal output (HDOD) protein
MVDEERGLARSRLDAFERRWPLLDLDAVIAATGELRPLPATTARLTQLLSQDDVDLREVSKVVALDGPLTGRLLRTANSAFYAGRVAAYSVEDAVRRLGTGVVLSLAISATLRRELERGIPEYGLGEGQLWRRSVASALAAESLRGGLRRAQVPPVAHTAALLHDIGRLVLARFLDPEARKLLDRANVDPDVDEAAIERRLLGVNHSEVGALIAQRWRLPRVISHAIEFCREPDLGVDRLHGYENPTDEAQFDVTCDVVHVADAIARALTKSDKRPLTQIAPNVRSRLGCDDAVIQEAFDRAAKRFDEVLALYG